MKGEALRDVSNNVVFLVRLMQSFSDTCGELQDMLLYPLGYLNLVSEFC